MHHALLGLPLRRIVRTTELLRGSVIMKNFNTLSEREILALAISLEEEDERVYADFAEGLMQDFPAMQIGAGRSSFSRSIDEPGDYPQRKLLAVPTSRAANQYPSPEDQGASQR